MGLLWFWFGGAACMAVEQLAFARDEGVEDEFHVAMAMLAVVFWPVFLVMIWVDKE